MIEGLQINNERALCKAFVLYKGAGIRRRGRFIDETSVCNLRNSAATLGNNDSWTIGACWPARWQWGSAHWAQRLSGT